MDKLTELYSPSCWVPGKSRDAVMNGFFAGIQTAYEELKSDPTVQRLEDVAYGDGESQKVDVWGEVDDKLLIFVHGGYWAAGTRKDCVTPAKCTLANGFAFASVGYGLSINGRTITETVDDVVKGVEFLLQKYPTVTNIIVGGHSAGAHLAFHAVTKLRNSRINGLLLFSGCYFLQDLVTTEIGTDISLTEDQAESNSCNLALLDGLNLKTMIILGLQEAPKLIEQNREFAKERGETDLVEVPESSHYTIMTNMLDATSNESLAVSKYLQEF